MKIFFNKLVCLLATSWVWSLLLILLAAVSIWLFGQELAVSDNRFWASAASRLTTISLLFLFWGLAMVFLSGRGKNRGRKGDSAADHERVRQDVLIEKERKALATRFKDVLRVLKESSLYGARGARWRQELPWYLLIGPQGSGKTSLLDFSGLDFPLNRSERKLTRDTRSTSDCEWYFTDQAVIMDTAGRYFKQPASQVDGSAWTSLLGLLRNRRRVRPLSGILVTLPIDMLLNDDVDNPLDELAETVRRRLYEVYQRLHVDVPVYLVLTKADSLTGFDEFFEQLSKEESEQVLGVTFRNGQAGTDVEVLRQEFEALLQRLASQLITRIHQERSTQRRGRMLDFPNQFARIGYRLEVFVEQAFSGNRYQRGSQLRGFYLTRAPHVIGKAAAAIQDTQERIVGLPELHAGRARFIHDLLSRVIFPESGLAVLDSRARRKINWRQRGLQGLALGLLAVFGTLWALGFNANHERLETLRLLSRQLTQQWSSVREQDDLLTVLQPLNTAYEASRVFPATDETAVYERNGLYQGEPANIVLKQAYHQQLQAQMLPRVARMLETQMQANLSDRQQLLDSLRAYLMLRDPERRDVAWLKARLASDWSLRYSGHLAAQQQLGDHFARLLTQPFAHPFNAALVAQARQVLRSESMAHLVYRALVEKARVLPEYSLAQHIGPQGALLAGADYRLPGLYTRKGYQQFFISQGSAVVSEILRDNWVLGEGKTLNPLQLHALMVELEQLYFGDYADHWAELVGKVSLQPFEGARQGAVLMAGLTSASSPLLQLLIEVRENTLFPVLADMAREPSTAAVQALKKVGAPDSVAAANGLIQETGVQTMPDNAKRALLRRFTPLHRLLDNEGGPAADLDALLAALNDVQLQMAALARAGQPELAAYEMAKARLAGQRDALSQLRQTASRLPQPVAGWLNDLAESTWGHVLYQSHQYLNQRYRDELYTFYGQALDKRYPFDAHSSSDVALNDFREFFKSQGLAERFFDSYLKPFVSGDPGHYRLRSIDGLSLPMSRAYLDQMAKVSRIRKSFFASDTQEPQVQFKLEPYTLDQSVSRAEFRLGDQSMEYRHGPIVSALFTWPTDVDDGRASLVLDRSAGRPLGLEKNTGPWSLFRLFDLMQTEPLKGRDVLVLKADLGGMRANYLLMSQRSPNPFDMSVLRSFRMPAQL
ncbi:type VI secretion system membrane subunit TssM [Pseudomonas sp. CDFA 602]|uniref:type VI secretion system membrane subunit TssM n=1 Tax=Pseudomonas californiensis TaxID=2829823 RepID=UPI001E32726C|nr:type VI secretion system membrane subunit TssM [Pseudomonas californiensis]MCD5994594.1 type VI secretion system membrane subunit TssM [Pseudomonas californiensis]MCD6000044.1 type VI secretion system membrane subunit TssM [Pseudomonas californiensis]